MSAKGEKRKASEDPQSSTQAATKKALPLAVNAARVRSLKSTPDAPTPTNKTTTTGPVIYWMSRDQRVRDNWALLYACQQAAKSGAPVAVAFNLVTDYLGAGARQFAFMVRGLRVMAPKLEALGIPFFFLQGDPTQTIPALVAQSGASLLVTDYGPLRMGRQWRDAVAQTVACHFHEVDAHNVVPVWEASGEFTF